MISQQELPQSRGSGRFAYTLVFSLLLLLLSFGATAPLNAQLATATIASSPKATLPDDFLGLSMEWRYAQQVMGSTITSVDPIFRQLLNNLIDDDATAAPGNRRPMIIRIGGGSTDLTSDNPASPSMATLQPFIDLNHDLGVRFILGVNAKAFDTKFTQTQASFYAHNMPPGSLVGLEIGNEPELYGKPPDTWYDQLDKDLKTVESVSGDVKPVVNCAFPDCTFAKTDFHGKVDRILGTSAHQASMFTSHFYTGGCCDRPADWLLQPRAATLSPAMVAAVSAAHRAGLKFRVDEMNSLANGGQPGISDTFQAALWMLQELFALAAEGADGVNIQGFWIPGKEHYSPATIEVNGTGSATTYRLVQVQPIYYVMLLFQHAAQPGLKLFPVSFNTTAHLYGWFITGKRGDAKLVIDNMDQTHSGEVDVHLPEFSSAKVAYLRAPSFSSSSGITLQGQTFDGSTGGKLRGDLSVKTVTKSQAGIFAIDMPAASAAVVSFED